MQSIPIKKYISREVKNLFFEKVNIKVFAALHDKIYIFFRKSPFDLYYLNTIPVTYILPDCILGQKLTNPIMLTMIRILQQPTC